MITKTQAKYIQSLSHKKFRNEEGVFVAEGPKIINELLAQNNVQPVTIYALDDWMKSFNADSAVSTALELVTIRQVDLDRISFLSTGNQVLGVFKMPVFGKRSNPLQLMLDGIQDPGNLGTIVRIADWFGIGKVICSNDTADLFNPKVVQSTMGSIARIEVIYDDLETYMKNHPQSYYGATLDGKPVDKIGKLKSGVIVIGNESKGIRPGVFERLTDKITINRIGQAESLNAAVATGIILSHLV